MKRIRIFSVLLIIPMLLVGMILPANAASPSANVLATIKNYGGGGNDAFYSVVPTADGGFIAAGESSSNDGDFIGRNKGNSDAILVKFDGNGNKQWTKDIGGSSQDVFNSVIQTADGGFVAAGVSSSNDGDFIGMNKGSIDAVIVKFDGSGTVQWVKDIGGSGQDIFRSVAQTADGGFVAAGESSSNDNDFDGMNKGGADAIVVKFDSGGDKKWVKDIGGSGDDYFYSVAKTADGGFAAAGYSPSNDHDFAGINKNGNDAILAKFDDSGNKQWMKDIGGSSEDAFYSVVQTSDGGFAAAGLSTSNDDNFAGLSKGASDMILVKLDGSGNKQWIKNIGGSSSEVLYAVAQTADGGLIAAGSSSSNDGDFTGLNRGFNDAIIVKFDGGGNKQWIRNIGGESNETFFSVGQEADGGFIAAGRSASGNGDFSGLNKGNTDAIIVRLSTSPAAPSNVTVTPGNGQVSVSFSVPSYSGGSPITGYTVIATPSNGGTALTATGTQSPITVTGLQNGVSYSFTVYATNSVGNGLISIPVPAMPQASSPSIQSPKTGDNTPPVCFYILGIGSLSAAAFVLMKCRLRNN